ncbi:MULTISPECIES: SulP family inorganic anion transporter [unclassified Marinimicrobium]|jgi:SulP family sulfate permease|uniref:SulP family inorganic anion transporter n=2 Tax=Marinimicrobium TaxID=359337 RepID=UPI000C3BD636|nr:MULTISPECIES: SulP family inorganic anion transporter [unclassified Marinimicrobium]MAN52941.1 sodium-independent anion transporter [Marinimicrobium sp.]|tara:strand:- start:277 stop:1929 length:1653 start_codon:yes stop_codon:yes gene_type:complete
MTYGFVNQLFNQINLKNLRGDVFGGLTAAIVSLPMALAFGVASGAGAEAGLYGAICVGLFASLFGGTPTLISEPTGPMTVVMTAVLTSLVASHPENGLAMAFTVVMIAGLFQILLGLLKLGRYITMMPYSVISGFMSGIGIILIILQFGPMLGQPSVSGGVLNNLLAIPQFIKNLSVAELSISLTALLALFFIPKRIAKVVPPQLIVLVLGTAIALLLFGDNLRLVGPISLGIPDFYLPYFTADQVTTMLIDGMVLGTLGCIDALLTAVIADSLTRNEHNSNKELIGQGIGNLASGFIGGLPGAGATMGTVVNIQTGARTALSGIVRAAVLLVVVAFASGLASNIPLAILAAIAVKVGLSILDWSFLKRAHRVSTSATLIMYLVIALTVLVDLMVAVGLGVFIANIITIDKLSRLQAQRNMQVISDVDDNISLESEEKKILEKNRGDIALLYFSGPLIFGMSRALARERNSLNAFRKILIDLTDVPTLDTTMVLALENTIQDAVQSGKLVTTVCSNTNRHTSLHEFLESNQIPKFTSRIEALTWLADKEV